MIRERLHHAHTTVESQRFAPEVALYADNPGIWRDRHNLEHAALGMVTRLAYRGIATPFDHGELADNTPE